MSDEFPSKLLEMLRAAVEHDYLYAIPTKEELAELKIKEAVEWIEAHQGLCRHKFNSQIINQPPRDPYNGFVMMVMWCEKCGEVWKGELLWRDNAQRGLSRCSPGCRAASGADLWGSIRSSQPESSVSCWNARRWTSSRE